MNVNKIFPGVAKVTFGTPEIHTPVNIRNIAPDIINAENLPKANDFPFQMEKIIFKKTSRGCVIELPLQGKEDIYGFGLQLKSHCQTGKKKTIRVNSDPVADTGDSHAPVPFYLSTNGYGILVDTARYANFYCGSHRRREDTNPAQDSCLKKDVSTSTDELYDEKVKISSSMMVEIPVARGVDIYVFSGPSMKDALSRYVMFSGGGCLPPLWGLGILYRGYAKNNQEDTLRLAKQFRKNSIPCDVFGLEPGWMDKSYSCNFVWNKENFPDTDSFLKEMQAMGYEINLWEQLFVHPSAPFYSEIKQYAGDFDVWEGLVPDFSIKEARDIYSKYQREHFIDRGIHGVKIDECDNSDFIRFPWSFPETSEFPSGMDGEQMHSCLGRLGQETLLQGFREANKRTYSNCRSSHALASPYPMVVYSDLYEHGDFIRGTVNAGLSGLLWTPEVRRCTSTEDLIRRIQSVILSPMALINAWTIKNPPWLQYDELKNNADILLDNAKDIESVCRELFQLRMSLIPYLYTSFAQYRFSGTPPFRALVLDYPEDVAVREIDNQYMVGASIMFAPLIAGNISRSVYFPEGEWIDFFSNKVYAGGQTYELAAEVEEMLLFVKNNTLLPLADPLEHMHKDTHFDITVRVYGSNPDSIVIFQDDGYSYAYENAEFNRIKLSWNSTEGGTCCSETEFESTIKYSVNNWEIQTI